MLTPFGQAVRVWEAEQSAPYAFDEANLTWVGYDSIYSVATKVMRVISRISNLNTNVPDEIKEIAKFQVDLLLERK